MLTKRPRRAPILNLIPFSSATLTLAVAQCQQSVLAVAAAEHAGRRPGSRIPPGGPSGWCVSADRSLAGWAVARWLAHCSLLAADFEVFVPTTRVSSSLITT